MQPMGIPPGFTLFATNTNRWEFWVPPAHLSTEERISKFVFWHPSGAVGKTGDERSVSVGRATVNTDNNYFTTSDVENHYSGSKHGLGLEPHLPGFLVIWFSYLRSIAGPPLNCPGVEVTGATDLGKHLLALGFKVGTVMTNYLGAWDAIDAKVAAARGKAGWTLSS